MDAKINIKVDLSLKVYRDPDSTEWTVIAFDGPAQLRLALQTLFGAPITITGHSQRYEDGGVVDVLKVRTDVGRQS